MARLILIIVSEFLAFCVVAQVLFHPGWAFKQAHRLPKLVWLLIGIAGFVPPLGLVFGALWIVRGRAVQRADHVHFNAYRERRNARRAMQSDIQTAVQNEVNKYRY